MAGRPSTSGTTVKMLSGSRPAPIGSVYFPSVSRARPDTEDEGDGFAIQVVQPARLRPSQSDFHSSWAGVAAVTARARPTARYFVEVMLRS